MPLRPMHELCRNLQPLLACSITLTVTDTARAYSVIAANVVYFNLNNFRLSFLSRMFEIKRFRPI